MENFPHEKRFRNAQFIIDVCVCLRAYVGKFQIDWIRLPAIPSEDSHRDIILEIFDFTCAIVAESAFSHVWICKGVEIFIIFEMQTF
jgi:hypothetical protein